MATLVAGDPPERVGTTLVLLDGGQGVVQDDRIALELEVVEALLDIDGGHIEMVAVARVAVARVAVARLGRGTRLPA